MLILECNLINDLLTLDEPDKPFPGISAGFLDEIVLQ